MAYIINRNDVYSGILFFILIVPTNALGLIEVDITRGNLNPLPIAVSPLAIDEQSKKSFEKVFDGGRGVYILINIIKMTICLIILAVG